MRRREVAALAMIRLGVDQLDDNADAAVLGVFLPQRKFGPASHVYGANGDQAVLAPERVVASVIVDLPKAFLSVHAT